MPRLRIYVEFAEYSFKDCKAMQCKACRNTVIMHLDKSPQNLVVVVENEIRQ